MFCAVLGASALLSACAGLPKPDALITGRAFTRNRLYIPPDAVFEAVLLDITNDNAPPIALGRQRVEPAGPAPYDLAIPFARSSLQRNGKYVVQAQVTLYNELLIYTPGMHPVMQDPAFQRVDVIIEPYPRSDATNSAGIAMPYTHWQLLSVGEESVTPVSAPAENVAPAFIQFQPTVSGLPEGESRGEFVGSGGCNRFLGSYQIRGSALSLQLSTTSIRLCLEGGKDEPAFLSALAQVRGFRQQGRDLELLNEDGKTFLRFRAEQAGAKAFEPYEPPNSQQ